MNPKSRQSILMKNINSQNWSSFGMKSVGKCCSTRSKSIASIKYTVEQSKFVSNACLVLHWTCSRKQNIHRKKMSIYIYIYVTVILLACKFMFFSSFPGTRQIIPLRYDRRPWQQISWHQWRNGKRQHLIGVIMGIEVNKITWLYKGIIKVLEGSSYLVTGQ